MIKVIAFDVFGTLVDMKDVPKEEIAAYGRQLRGPVWKPLVLPNSWTHLLPFTDVLSGLHRLSNEFRLVTCTNAPLGFQRKLFRNCDLDGYFGADYGMVPLEYIEKYKTARECYQLITTYCHVRPAEVMMVTANRDFGDLEASEAIGMVPQLIRHPGCPDLLALADQLGC